MKLGEKLRKVRLERKMTQRELAGNDFTAPFISQVEKGLTVPSLKALVTLANHLGCSPGYFLETRADAERDRIETLLNLGRSLLVLEDREAALAHFREALKTAQDLNDSRCQARARYHLALAHAGREDYEQARSDLTVALEEFERLEDTRGMACVHFQLGLIHQRFRNPKGAIQAYQRALAALGGFDDPVLGIKLRANLGATYLSLGESEQGIALTREAADQAGEVADLPSLGRTCIGRALARRAEEDPHGALVESCRAWQILQALDLTRMAAKIQSNMGVVAAEQGRWEDAGAHFARSLELHHRIGDCRGKAHALTELARYHQHRGESELALERGRKALAIASDLESPLDQARAHSVLGSICRQSGSRGEALTHLLASVETFERLEQPQELANSYYELGELLLTQDRKEEALDYFQKSASLLRRMGSGQPACPEPEPKSGRLSTVDPVT